MYKFVRFFSHDVILSVQTGGVAPLGTFRYKEAMFIIGNSIAENNLPRYKVRWGVWRNHQLDCVPLDFSPEQSVACTAD